MIISNRKTEFPYYGKTYRVGDTVIANGESVYSGLIGTICEIRTDGDKETDNEEPEIYCRFAPPQLSSDISELEKRYSGLCGEERKIGDIPLDSVIMPPDMLISPDGTENREKVYLLTEEWANDGDGGVNTSVFTDILSAKAYLNRALSHEVTDGVLAEWKNNADFEFEEDNFSYKGWNDGYYSELHYSVYVEEREMTVSPEFVRRLGERFIFVKSK